VAYCEWLSKEANKNYHLLSKVECKYTARGGNKSKQFTFSGSNTVVNVAMLIQLKLIL
jgi:formylglycine-generating enzyme required for sulfatase activity